MNHYTKRLLVTVLSFQMLATPLMAQEGVSVEDMGGLSSLTSLKRDFKSSLKEGPLKLDMFETDNFRFETLQAIRGHQLDLVSEFCSAYISVAGHGSSILGGECDETSLYKTFLLRMAAASEIARTFFVYDRSNQNLVGVLKGEQLEKHVLFSGTLISGSTSVGEIYGGLYAYAQEKAKNLQDPTTFQERTESKISSPVQIQGAGWNEGILPYEPKWGGADFPVRKRDGELTFAFANFATPAAAKISASIRFLSEDEKAEILAREPDTKIVTIHMAGSLQDFPMVRLIKSEQENQNIDTSEQTSYFTLKNTILAAAGTTLAILLKKSWNRFFKKPPMSPGERARREAARRFRPSHPENRGDDGFSPRLPTPPAAFFPGYGGSASPSVVLPMRASAASQFPVRAGAPAASQVLVRPGPSAEELRNAEILAGLTLPELPYVNYIPARVGRTIADQDYAEASRLAREIRVILQNSDVKATQGVKAWDDAVRRLRKALDELEKFNN